MNAALLVLACKAPKVLEILARNFSKEPFRIFVHLDAKVDLEAYSRGRDWPENLEFLEQRFEIFWGGFNMVRATEALALRALRDLGAEGLSHTLNGDAAHTEDGRRLFQSGSNPRWKQNGLTESKGAGAPGVPRDLLGFIDEVGVDGGFSCHPYTLSKYISS